MDFQSFNKIPRLSRDIIITEKIDGTNGQICIVSYNKTFAKLVNEQGNIIVHCDEETQLFIDKFCLVKQDDLYIFAGSHKRWVDTSSKGDNFGFAKWVKANAGELLKLGEGRHYGEWWGKGIQRGYGLDEKRFSLFNRGKWNRENAPECCSVVPILYEGIFDTEKINQILKQLEKNGSLANPGFMNPEGIIIYHTASGKMFKKTILNDEKPKSLV